MNAQHLQPNACRALSVRVSHWCPATLETALRPDPLGLSRFAGTPITGTTAPGMAWLPTAIVRCDTGPAIDWTFFGDLALTHPFFHETARLWQQRPINQLIKHRTPLSALLKLPATTRVMPDGLVFHMSRCGSTLVAQMAATMADAIVISEAAPLDGIIRHVRDTPDLSRAEGAGLIRGMVNALCRNRTSVVAKCFVKLDAWHTLAMPL